VLAKSVFVSYSDKYGNEKEIEIQKQKESKKAVHEPAKTLGWPEELKFLTQSFAARFNSETN